MITNHATDLSGIELYDFTPGGASQTYLGRNDHGDVTWTAIATGAVTARASYDPFGNLAASSGTVPASRWQGSYLDGASGLYYVNARWYAPSLGTFLSDDPLTADTSDPQGRDPYAYGAGDAVDRADPSGRCYVPGTNYYYACDTPDCSVPFGCSSPPAEPKPIPAPIPNPLNVPNYSANYGDWASDWMGTNATHPRGCGHPIGTVQGWPPAMGCGITSAAMVLARFDSRITPKTLNAWLGEPHQILKKVFTLKAGSNQCGIGWSDLFKSHFGTGFTKSSRFGLARSWDQLPPKSRTIILSELSKGRPVIAHMRPEHFVVITGVKGHDFIINESKTGAKGTLAKPPYFFSGSHYAMDYFVTVSR